MEIKVLGSGCMNCNNLEKLVFDVLAELNADADVAKVTDVKEILAYGVMSPPALVINGKVKITGYVPPKAKIMELISAELGK